MGKNIGKSYGEYFFSSNLDGMSKSAEIVLSFLYEHYKPKSIIDVGCGRGAWLLAAESLGAEVLKGLDGEWVKPKDLLSKNIDFLPVDFEKPIPNLNIKYDLCISLEVAEHISEDKADNFVNFLCEESEVILFSSAVKDQRGAGHVNEQFQSYWVDKFKDNEYECLDIIRPNVWDNSSVEWWYRQNTLLFVKSNNALINSLSLKKLDKLILDIIHPINYENKIKSYLQQIKYPSFLFCLGALKRYVKNRLNKKDI